MRNRVNIESWYQEPLGEALLKTELNGLSSVLPKIFGYYIVQVGGPTDHKNSLLASSRIHNHIVLNPTSPTLPRGSSAIQTKLNELPFLPESIDAIVLFHILEFSKNPRRILQETYDAIIKDGHLVVLGFNPYSLWGISRLFRSTKNGIWRGNWISPDKLRNWLTDTGFHVGDYQTFYFRPPRENPEKMLFMEGLGQILWPYYGASYMFVAHKISIEITPVGELKNMPHEHKIVESLPKPTSRVIQ